MSRVPGFQSCRAVEFWGCTVPSLQGCWTRFQGWRVPRGKVPRGKVPRLQGSRNPRLQVSRVSKLQDSDFRVPGLQGSRALQNVTGQGSKVAPRFQGCRFPFRITGLQDFTVSDVSGFQDSGVPGSSAPGFSWFQVSQSWWRIPALQLQQGIVVFNCLPCSP